jgi:hypothetical protein
LGAGVRIAVSTLGSGGYGFSFEEILYIGVLPGGV